MNIYKWFLAIILLVFMGACVQPEQYRKITVKQNANKIVDDVCEFKTKARNNTLCADHAVIHRHYTHRNNTNDYYTAFVEFDDQGWFWDRRQMESLLRLLYKEKKKNKDVIMIVYAHGWKHNASACDNNVICFQRLLERFDLLEREAARIEADKTGNRKKNTARTIVGVYVGWRGKSISVPLLKETTFWSRKSTASRVGVGGVTILLSELNRFRDYANPEREKSGAQLIITGHSFGGMVIYSALSNLLIDRATNNDGNKIDYDVAKSFGDLVVLVNPAFEGSLYEPLHHIATNRCYPEEQRPILLIVTSEADDATKKAFPIGRWLNTIFQRKSTAKDSNGEQYKSIINTVGHLDRYRTHKLVLKDPKKDRKIRADDKGCGCKWLGEIGGFDTTGSAKYIEYISKKTVTVGGDNPAKMGNLRQAEEEVTQFEYGDNLILKQEKTNSEYSPNHPYLVVQASKEIIGDHNAIYDEDFIDFLQKFYIRHIQQRINFPRTCYKNVPACERTDITQCERSCQRKDGTSCSSRPEEIYRSGQAPE